MHSEYKEKQGDAKVKLQSDITTTVTFICMTIMSIIIFSVAKGTYNKN